MKPLYTFKVGEGENEKKIAILKPTYSQVEAAEFIYGQHFNKLIQDGFMSRAMMDKKFNDIGGLFAQKTRDEVNESIKSLMDVAKTIEFYHGADEGDLDEEQKEQLKNAEDNYISIQQTILEKDYNLEQMYNQSADAKAEQHLMKWFTLQCSFYYQKVFSREENKVVEEKFELFEGSNFEEKLDQFNLFLEEIDDDDDDELTDRKKLIVEALPTLNKALSLWYKQLANDQKSMEKALKQFFPEEKKDEEEETQEEPLKASKDNPPSKKKSAKKKATKKKVANPKAED
tara:strand:+ start:42 stop:902 length:861 start_codon:yes stop_codon:yes gene_type:complete